jgi:Zn ribbon nucleic-acid-binding protein
MRTKVQQGLCPKCEEQGKDGWLQYDKVGEVVYCNNCNWRIAETDFEAELEEAVANEYKVAEADENLSKLNNL